VSDFSFREQVLRFYLPVQPVGWTDEAEIAFLRDYSASSSSPSVNRFAEQVIDGLRPQARRDMLETAARECTFRQRAFPFLDRAARGVLRIAETGLDLDVFILAFCACQTLADDMREQGIATVENGILRADDHDLLLCTFGKLRMLKDTIEQATALDADAYGEYDARARQTARLIIFLMESFRRAHTWSDLPAAERKALEPPCRECVRAVFGEPGVAEAGERIPWPFAFLAWYPRHWTDLPCWLVIIPKEGSA
jgi:hypothetical protein